jgi:hypothetical protein
LSNFGGNFYFFLVLYIKIVELQVKLTAKAQKLLDFCSNR